MENMDIDSIKWGEEYEDLVTGFKGFVTSKHLYTTGCHQVGLSAKASKDGECKFEYADITLIKRVGAGVAAKLVKVSPPVPTRGGPQLHPYRH